MTHLSPVASFQDLKKSVLSHFGFVLNNFDVTTELQNEVLSVQSNRSLWHREMNSRALTKEEGG